MVKSHYFVVDTNYHIPVSVDLRYGFVHVPAPGMQTKPTDLIGGMAWVGRSIPAYTGSLPAAHRRNLGVQTRMLGSRSSTTLERRCVGIGFAIAGCDE